MFLWIIVWVPLPVVPKLVSSGLCGGSCFPLSAAGEGRPCSGFVWRQTETHGQELRPSEGRPPHPDSGRPWPGEEPDVTGSTQRMMLTGLCEMLAEGFSADLKWTLTLCLQAVCNVAPRGIYVCGNSTSTTGNSPNYGFRTINWIQLKSFHQNNHVENISEDYNHHIYIGDVLKPSTFVTVHFDLTSLQRCDCTTAAPYSFHQASNIRPGPVQPDC